ncbi:MAG: response regulator transcription factor [Micrococcales bacterium]|nr:response regulator transcription factor [Micrococcales bacterium]
MPDLLLVDDAETLRETLAFLLAREGYTVRTAGGGAEALALFEEAEPDLVLLDVMLPEVSGTEVLRRIRLTSEVPVIMLTAKDAEGDIVVGLELGADDYVTKPFSTPELLARMRSALRRRAPRGEDAKTSVLSAGAVVMDTDRHSVTVDDREVSMPLREFTLLELLLRNAGRVLTRGQIIDRVWGSEYYGDTKTLDVHIRRLRGRIEADPAHPTRLITVRGLGYRLEE